MNDTVASQARSSDTPAPLMRPRRTYDAQARKRSKFFRKYGHLLFVVPGFAFFLAFIVYPAVSGFAISLTAWTGVGNDFHFVGLANFQEALSSWPLYRAAWHNLIMFVAILIFQHTVGLFIAVQLNARPRFVEVYRTILFLPVIISLVSTGFIWTLMLSPNIGVINPILHDIGLGFLARSWLSDPNFALGTVIAVQCWNVLGWAIIIYLSGLQNIPEELLQAAEIDGATGWQRFRRVVFPLLSPSFTALTVLTFIGQFRVFDIVYVLTGPIGSPDFETDVLGTLIYRAAFGGSSVSSNDVRMSYGIAIALIVFVAMAIVSTILVRVLRRREIDA
ncbi:MAG: sugar ABC transporter permease [Hyphomicrobiaceae bacterium]|nr:sugar ABC transporter permease [Hyphomicrobiaceae bacterium]